MASRAEHYRLAEQNLAEAERLLREQDILNSLSDKPSVSLSAGATWAASYLTARAQVHATLATAASAVAPDLKLEDPAPRSKDVLP